MARALPYDPSMRRFASEGFPVFRRRVLFAGLLVAVLAEAGCRHTPCRREPLRRPVGGDPNPNALGDPIPPRVIPLEAIPPTGVPPTPRPSNYPPSGGAIQRDYLPGPAPGVLGEPVAPVERIERLRPVPQPPLEVPAQPKLLVPVPLPGEVPDRPAPTPAKRNDLPPPVVERVPEKPPEKLALELPGFATVLDRVTASRKPTTDGFAWLKTNGYKTVAYLHDPDAKDVDSARQLTEKQGLKFVAIPVSPETLPAAYKAFAELVKDASARPLHAFATSGNRAGSLWYLVFREVELLPDDAARVRAGKLGLERPEDSEEAKRFWLAVQQFLSKH